MNNVKKYLSQLGVNSRGEARASLWLVCASPRKDGRYIYWGFAGNV
jgi:hypothetical protein